MSKQRQPEDVVNFAAGPAKIPREVSLYYLPKITSFAGIAGSSSSCFELGRYWHWSHGSVC